MAESAGAVTRVSAEPGAISLTLAERRALLRELDGPLAISLKHRLQVNDVRGFDVVLLSYMLHRDTARYFFRPKDVPAYVEFMKSQPLTSTQVTATTARANALLAHRFPEQLNSQSYTVQLPSGEVDWDRQPAATGNIGFLNSLNRHRFWEDLAQAYRITGDVRYANELIAQLRSWSRQNPAPADPAQWRDEGPGWVLLNAADRAKNWLRVYFMMLGTPAWTPEVNALFLHRLWHHGDFLARASGYKITTNKAAVHAAGLSAVATLFPEFTDAATWQTKGSDLLFRSLAAQYYPDGGHVEQSPSYAAATSNALLEDFLLAENNGQTRWTRGRRIRLTNTVEALYQLIAPDETLPALSDTFRSSTPRPFLTRASLILGDDRYARARPGLEDVWLLGPGRVTPLLDSGAREGLAGRGLAYALEDSGYYVLRGAATGALTDLIGNAQIVFDAGPKGAVHGHYDLLSFELSRKPFGVWVADPGPFEYNDTARREFAVSTPAHNTISIDGLNHAPVEGAHNPMIAVDEFTATDQFSRVTAHHHAYSHLAGSPVVGRSIRMSTAGPFVLVVDWGRSSAAHTFTTSLNLPDNGDLIQVSAGIVDRRLTQFAKVRVQSVLLSGQTVSLTDSFVSNQPPPAPVANARRQAVSQRGTFVVFATLITQYTYSGNGAAPPPVATFEKTPQSGQPVHIRVTAHDGTFQIYDFPPPDLSPLPAAELVAPRGI